MSDWAGFWIGLGFLIGCSQLGDAAIKVAEVLKR